MTDIWLYFPRLTINDFEKNSHEPNSVDVFFKMFTQNVLVDIMLFFR
jgi:hypothetical protein